MQINEEFWGGAEQTTTSSNGTKWTSYTLKDALNQENNPGWELPFNEEWDTSICPWAISPDADFMKIGYSSIYRDANNETHVASAALLEEESSGIPIWFGVNANIGNTGVNFKWGGRNAYSQAYIQNTYNTHSNQYAMRGFDYSKLVYLIRVKVAQYQMEGADRYDYCRGNVYDLASYINNYETLKSMPIIQIYMIPYYWTGNAEYPNQRTAIDLNINTLGRFKTIDKAFTDAGIDLGGSLSAETCYTNDYLDYFMSVMGGYTDGTSTPSSAGIGYQPNGELIARNRLYLLNPNNGQWFRSFAEAFNYNYTIGTLDSNTFNWPCRVINSDMWDLTVDSSYAANGYGVVRPELRVNEKFANAAEAEAYILKQAAYLGTWFITDSSVLHTEPGSSDKWYLGEIDSDGVTTGNYRQGSATSELPNSEWEDAWEDSGWNGRPEDPNKYDKDLKTERIQGTAFYGKNDYIMTPLTFWMLLAELEDRYKQIMETAGWLPETAEAQLLAAFGTTENPISLIEFAYIYPFDLGSLLPIDEAANQQIRVGNTDFIIPTAVPQIGYNQISTTVAVSVADYNTFFTDKINYFKQFNSFLDYEPYSSAELWVPWCGTVKIDPQIYCGHDISVDYTVDIEDGSLKAQIYRDKLQIDEIKGQVGSQIPLNYTDFTEIINARIQAKATEKANKTKFATAIGQVGMTLAGIGITAATMGMGAPVSAAATASLATASTAAQRSMAAARISDMTNAAQKANTTTAMGMGMQALGTALNTATSIASANNYHISPGGVTFREISTSNGKLSIQNFEPYLRLNTYRPKFLNGYTKKDFGLYGHQVGFACLKYDQLKNYSGLTCCGSVDLSEIKVERQGQISIVPTQEEIDIIRKSLQTGVYLP